MTDSGISIRHDADQHRFVAVVDGAATGAMLRYRRVDDATLDYFSTFTPPELRGRGLAAVIVRAALDYARENGLGIVPTCPYVAKLIEREPQYRELVRSEDPR